MVAEKLHNLKGELPIAINPTTPAYPRTSRIRRIAARFAIAGLALWLFSHSWHFFSGHSQIQINEHGHGAEDGMLRGKSAEELYLSVPNAASALAASRQYAMKPHLAGTPQDLSTAKDFLATLQTNFGINPPADEPIFPAGTVKSRNATLSIPFLDSPQAWIDTYYPVLNTPLDRALEILDEDGKPVWQANLEEVVDETDPEAAKYFNAVPTFHGLSKDGEVQGRLVDVNYGRKEDYEALIAAGVDLTGKIAIARYFRTFRGLKVKGAQELGAIGVLIYSDPHDDGTVTEKNGYAPYPQGPARNPNSVQRGSVQFLSIYPGDPTTPGFPSYENSTRMDALNIPSIPSLPISWNNAQVLLKEIAEGGSNRIVKLVNHVDTKVTPIWNTMGVIPGHIKDEIIVVGNHRDAWVMGAGDPTSGTSSLHEVIRGLGVLLQHGWKPLRTIVVASWDAEEYGLIGSTEWGEDFEDFIKKYVVAYLNVDIAVSGSRYEPKASPSLAHLIRETAKEIAHPSDLGRSLWDARTDRGKLFGGDVDEHTLKLFREKDAKILTSDNFGIEPLGSGSDFTVFLQRIGIASLSLGFGSTLSDPVYHYHSVFDTERWQELYGDPGFARHVAVAQHLGLQVLRMADSIIVPINTTHYAHQLEGYLTEVENIAISSANLDVDFSSLRQSITALQTASLNLDVEKAKAEHDLKRLLTRPKKRPIHRKLRKIWCKLKKALGQKCHGHHHHHDHEHDKSPQTERGHCTAAFKPRFGRLPGLIQEQSEKKYGVEKGHPHHRHHHHHHHDYHHSRHFIHAVKRVEAVNKKLSTFEQGFISEGGIKDREWYRHLGVAPGKWLGYGATTFPALTEALAIEKNATLAQYEIHRLKDLLDGIVKSLED